MSDLKYREQKMQEKRKQTSFRDFLKEIVSWYTLGIYKNSGLISRYPDSDRRLNVVSVDEFSKERDDLYYLDYDENQSFIEQYNSLVENCKISALNKFYGYNENSNFADGVFGTKNVYLSFVCGANVENICYSIQITTGSKNVFNSTYVIDNSENIYFSKFISKSFNIFYSSNILNSSQIRLSSNLIGCHDCIMCNDLENQSYCIENKSYTKEDYEKKKKEILDNKKDFEKLMIFKEGKNYQSNDVSGSNILYSENINNGYGVYRTINGANLIFAYSVENNNRNFYDGMDVGMDCDDFYGVICAGTNSNNFYCSTRCGKSSNLYYCENCESCSYCLGCIGLKNKSYCIFNKQYTKEERHELSDKIFAKMEQDGELGKFFPGKMNPFYFNDTAAYLIDDSFTKEEVEAEGYLRRDEEIKVDIPEGVDVISTKDLDQYEGFDVNGERKINPEILKKVVRDEKGNYYKIVKMEYDFLMKHGLPLPRLHWLDRIKLGFKFK